jgi:predicted ATPase
VASGALQADALQVRALQRLERLHVELKSYTRKPLPPPPAASGSKEWRGPKFDKYGTPTGGGSMYTGVANTDSGSGGGGLWGAVTSLFGGGGGSGDDGGAAKSGGDFELSGLEAVPLGVYMHGGVGCGKSLLMDTFFDCAPVPAEAKRRVHFHEFMLEVHNRMHKVRMQEPERGDPLPLIAHEISSATSLLCFDEFQVTDVADALVMRRLFRHLFSHGLVMVSTSNREPSQLYLNGIQRVSFLPFIDDLSARCETHDLASGTDYRTTAALGMTKPGGTYMHPLGPTTDAQMDALFEQLTLRGGVAPMTLRLQGRDLEVPRAGRTEKVARFSFEQLCGKPLGAEDYLGLAQVGGGRSLT